MATELNFIEYVRDQMQGAGQITFRKMFGEYALYCDNQVFGKPTAGGRAKLDSITLTPVYQDIPHLSLQRRCKS